MSKSSEQQGDRAARRRAERDKTPRVKNSWRDGLLEWIKAIAWALGVALLIRQFLFEAFTIPSGSMKNSLLVHDFLFVNKFLYGAKTPERLTIPFVNKTIVDGLPYLELPAIREPEQGDIIVFLPPGEEHQAFIKRCVATAGDTVLVRNGVLTVNGEIYESNFADKDGDHSCLPPFTLQEPSWDEKRAVPGIERRYRQLRPRFEAESFPADDCPTPKTRRDYLVYSPRGPLNDFGPFVVSPDHVFMMGDNRYNSSDSRRFGEVPVDRLRGKAEIIYWSYERLFLWPRWERLLMLIDVPPGWGWLQPLVRLIVLGLIGWGVWRYRRKRRAAATSEPAEA